MKIQEALLDLEKRVGALTGYPTIPGTTLSRVMLDAKHIPQAAPEMKPEPGRDFAWAWCLALGPLGEAKEFWYAATIIRVIQKARLDVIRAEKVVRKLR